MNATHVLSRAVIIDQQYIFLCETLGLSKNFYFLPGGHVEHGESVRACVCRELSEETGATLIIESFLGCLEYSFHPSQPLCHTHELILFLK